MRDHKIHHRYHPHPTHHQHRSHHRYPQHHMQPVEPTVPKPSIVKEEPVQHYENVTNTGNWFEDPWNLILVLGICIVVFLAFCLWFLVSIGGKFQRFRENEKILKSNIIKLQSAKTMQ